MTEDETVAEGVQIVSDGTVAGTAILVDGKPLEGEAHVMWSFSPEHRSARLVLDLRELAFAVANGRPGHFREAV